MEEIDDFYKQEMESADSEYVKVLEKKVLRQKAQEDYLKRLKKIREDYYKKYRNYLLKEKNNITKKELKEKREKFKKFKSESVRLKLNFFEALKIKKAIWLFNHRRKLRSFFYRVTPRFIIYAFFSLRKKKNLLSEYLYEKYEKTRDKFKLGVKNIASSVKDSSTKLNKKINETIKKVLSKIFKSKKKKEGASEENKETGSKSENSEEKEEKKEENNSEAKPEEKEEKTE